MSTYYRPWETLLRAADLVKGTLLFVCPHPDDEVLGGGGVILAHRDAGHRVVCAVMTDGRLGDADGRHGDGYVELRRRECRAAAAALGGVEPRFLDFPDFGLAAALAESGASPVERLRALIDELEPETLAFPSPWELHPDHRASALAALAAAERAAWKPRLLAYEVGSLMPANIVVDVSDLFPRKLAALRCYASQLEHHDLEAKLTGIDVARTANVDDRRVTHAEAWLRIDPAQARAFLDASETAMRITDSMAPAVPYA